MSTEVQDRITKATAVEVAVAFVRAWRHLFRETPSVQTVFLLLAQWALETGWGKACHCFNLGNAKWSTGFDWCCFACGEELTLESALRYQKADPDHVLIVRRYTSNSRAMASCKFLPPHRMTWFKAFETLDEGAVYYIGSLHKRFARSWPFILSGDPFGFGHALKLQGYYTADEAQYTGSLARTFHSMPSHVPDFDPEQVDAAPVETKDADPPGLSDIDKARIAKLVALTVEEQINDELDG